MLRITSICKNGKVFIILVVFATKKEFSAHCDKPEAILNNGLNLHFGEGESTLIVQALERHKGCYSLLWLGFTAHKCFFGWDFSS